MQTDYLAKNPVNLIKQRNRFYRVKQDQHIVRRLSVLQWEMLLDTAEKMATQYPHKYERTLFIISLLFGLYLRVSELVPRSVKWYAKGTTDERFSSRH